VFAQLAQLSQSHIAILRRYVKAPDKDIREICWGLDEISFPSTLNLEEQGRFALGYYHQRQSFFRGRPAAEVANEQPTQNFEGDVIQ
jgi:CRISPR-associated protein Csd1